MVVFLHIDSLLQMANNRYEDVGPYLNLLIKVGVSMCLSIISFLLIGIFLDRFIQSGGIVVIACILIGVMGGFYLVFKEIKKLGDLQDNEDQDNNPPT